MKVNLKKIMGAFNTRHFGFILALVLVVLVNILGIGIYTRFDLTKGNSYSLSKISRDVIRRLEDPLSVKVFFSKNLPSPYNSVERYLRDLLSEYKNSARDRMKIEFIDMDKDENRATASSYGISSINVREVKSDELKSRAAFMGVALTYGDVIETVPYVTSTDGLEYSLTTLMQKMIGKVSALTGLDEPVGVTLYASSVLQESAFNIQGLDTLETQVRSIFNDLNRESYDKLVFNTVDPQPGEVPALEQKYGVPALRWGEMRKDDGSTIPAGRGTLSIVLEYKQSFQTVPIDLSRQIFGGYAVTGLDTLADKLGAAIDLLVSTNPSIGYITGAGERSLSDQSDRSSSVLQDLATDMYDLREIALGDEGIPDDIKTLIINGPMSEIPEASLFMIDQFVMRGGSLFVLIDSFQEVQQNDPYSMYGGGIYYMPVTTGIETLLESYGISVNRDYVCDKFCYETSDLIYGDIPIYYIPVIERDTIDQNQNITRNLTKIAFLQTSSITLDTEKLASQGVISKALISSSSQSWLMTDNINLNPLMIAQPPADQLGSYPLVVMAEGRFESRFDSPPAGPVEEEDSIFRRENFLSKGTNIARIVVAGTSELTGPQLLDQEGKSSNAVLIHNIIDYLNGNEDIIDMRTKGLGLNPLKTTTPAVRNVLKIINIGIVPALILLAGFIIWRASVARRKRIAARFAERS